MVESARIQNPLTDPRSLQPESDSNDDDLEEIAPLPLTYNNGVGKEMVPESTAVDTGLQGLKNGNGIKAVPKSMSEFAASRRMEQAQESASTISEAEMEMEMEPEPEQDDNGKEIKSSSPEATPPPAPKRTSTRSRATKPPRVSSSTTTVARKSNKRRRRESSSPSEMDSGAEDFQPSAKPIVARRSGRAKVVAVAVPKSDRVLRERKSLKG